MESLGHYLLRDRIALPGDPAQTTRSDEEVTSAPNAPFEVFEGQDVRTGISILVFRPLPGKPPKLDIPSTLSWVDGEEGAWIAEVPVGAVQASWLAGRVEPARLLNWTRQLLEAVQNCQSQNVPVGWIVPELVWARGSRAWLGGVGVAREQRWDYAGLLNTLRVVAGDTYAALPWREPLEAFVTGNLEYPALKEQLEQISTTLEPLPLSLPVQEALPTPPEPEKPAPISKTLKVQIGEPEAVVVEPALPPKRIRIEDSLNPPFEVLEPQRSSLSRRGVLGWILLLVLLLVLGGAYYFLRPKPQASTSLPVYTVEFRLQPPGPTASIEVLEVPRGSKIPLHTILAEVPGLVKFDQSGIYRIRVRVQGRAPVDSIISVPNPGGVDINLR